MPPIRLTKCGHKYCQVCLEKFVNHDEWNCPTCRSLQREKPEDLTRDFISEKLVKKLQATKTSNKCKAHPNQELTLCKFLFCLSDLKTKERIKIFEMFA